jgi:hypothetical protein
MKHFSSLLKTKRSNFSVEKMDRELLRYTLDDGQYITVENNIDSDLSGSGKSLISSNRQTKVYDVGKHFEEAISTLKPVTRILMNSLREINTPDEIKIELGVKLSAKAGVILTSSGEGTMKITLSWKNSK